METVFYLFLNVLLFYHAVWGIAESTENTYDFYLRTGNISWRLVFGFVAIKNTILLASKVIQSRIDVTRALSRNEFKRFLRFHILLFTMRCWMFRTHDECFQGTFFVFLFLLLTLPIPSEKKNVSFKINRPCETRLLRYVSFPHASLKTWNILHTAVIRTIAREQPRVDTRRLQLRLYKHYTECSRRFTLYDIFWDNGGNRIRFLFDSRGYKSSKDVNRFIFNRLKCFLNISKNITF